jgi:hypothetical protein
LLGLALGAASPARSLDINGFLPARGRLEAALSFTHESWDEFWRGNTKVPTPPFLGKASINSSTLWLRYGLSDHLALVANLPYVDASSDGTTGFDETDLQDLSVLVKLQLVERRRGATRHRLLGGAGLRVPASDYEPNLPVDVGDGTTDVLLRLVYQLERGRFYFSQQLGLDVRSEDAPTGFPLLTEVGFRTGQITWIGSYQVLRASGGTDIGDPGFTFPSNQEEYQRLGARLYAQVTRRFGVTAGGFTTLDGRNAAASTGVFVGIVATNR